MLVPSIFSNNFVDDIFDDVFPFGAYNAPATASWSATLILAFTFFFLMDVLDFCLT